MRRITAPLSRLTTFAGHIAARRFDQRLEMRTRDELSVLGASMTKAAADLADARLKVEATIRGDLGRYLTADLVENGVRRKQDMSLGGVRRTISVL